MDDEWFLQLLMFHMMKIILTHYGLITPYGDIDLYQNWLRFYLDHVDVWQHQAITWTNVDLPSVESFGIHMCVISLEMLKLSIMYCKIKLPP